MIGKLNNFKVFVTMEAKGPKQDRRASPLKLEKNKIFWREIVIFHTILHRN
jgi:CRISPR/Cas system CMR-associated protein Cmr1 (group 7 of RAMP superfamily)